MVGTPAKTVMRCASMIFSAWPGSKRGNMLTLPPP